LLFLFLHL